MWVELSENIRRLSPDRNTKLTDARATIINTLLKILGGIVILGVAAAATIWNTRAGQDWLLEQAATAAMSQPPTISEFDGLQVFMCGTSSPIPDRNRAQACVAILAGESLYLVDAGAGSIKVAMLAQLPLERLEAVFLTHFHSDHIAALPDFNLNSWVAGRQMPLAVVGPPGVAEVVEGLTAAYRLDASYRVAHHGEELLRPDLGVMQSSLMEAGTSQEFGELTVISYEVNHDPIRPAVAYRFDYRGRSVVVSGDAILSQGLVDAATDADLLLQDALSLPIISTLELTAAGTRMENVLHDIQDYHLHTDDLPELVEKSGVRKLALYHLVPPPSNPLFENIFSRDLPAGTVITEDGMIFALPAGSEELRVIYP